MAQIAGVYRMRSQSYLLCAALFVAHLASGAPALAQAAPDAAVPMVFVTGEGVVNMAPDMAMITVGVVNRAETAKEAMAATNAAMTTLTETLKAAGIAARDLQTAGLSLHRGADDGYSSSKAETGFTARNELAVTVRALADLGRILDAAVADGANTLRGVQFGVADPAPLLDEARKRAVADARHRAEVMTTAAGLRLGQITQMADTPSGASLPGPMFARALMDSVPVEAGELAFSAAVSIQWQILQ
jgi:uncharacterized protein YggE